LLEEVDKDPWGRAYRIVTRKMGARTMLTAQDISHAVAKLFPPRLERHRPMPPVATCTPFTLDELRAAEERLRGGKAPGHFPETCKVGRLVLIPKKETDEEGRPKVRPICLLYVMGKLYEHLIRARLLIGVEKGGLS
jgi:hypothetical protein